MTTAWEWKTFCFMIFCGREEKVMGQEGNQLHMNQTNTEILYCHWSTTVFTWNSKQSTAWDLIWSTLNLSQRYHCLPCSGAALILSLESMWKWAHEPVIVWSAHNLTAVFVLLKWCAVTPWQTITPLHCEYCQVTVASRSSIRSLHPAQGQRRRADSTGASTSSLVLPDWR